MFDVDFAVDELHDEHLRALEKLSAKKPSRLNELLKTSYDWLFYRDADNEPWLPGTRRFDLTGHTGAADQASLLAARDFGVAVLSVWCPNVEHGEDLTGVKFASDVDDERVLHAVSRAGLGVAGSRQYPFVGVWAEEDLSTLVSDERAAELGRILTGNLEKSEESVLRHLIQSGNLSTRSYERLFVRWTDALGVYGPQSNEEEYLLTLFRGVQVFEACILTDTLLRSSTGRTRTLFGTVSAWWPRPWAVNQRLESAARITRQFVTSPSTQSVEADQLISGAYASFGIAKAADGLSTQTRLLESRFQWAKTQFIVTLGLVSFVLDKLKVFEWIARKLGIAH